MTVDRIKDTTEIYFPELGWRFHIDPTAFTVGGLAIQWYGILITTGLLLALLYCFPKMKRFGLDSDRAVDAVIGGVLGGIIGARIYYVLFNFSEFKKDSFGETLKSAVNIRSGGLAIYGGIIGALLVGLLMCKIRKVRKLPMLDITVLGFLIGQGVGRWGNFVNQEAFGTNTSSFFGMTGGEIQNTIIRETQEGGSMYAHDQATMMWEKAVHPCFLYESLWCILGFIILSWYSKHRKYDGQIFLMYLSWYGIERAFVEGLRTDSLYIGDSNLRISQLLSIVLVVVSVILQIVIYSKYRRDPESFQLYVGSEESHRLIEESRRKRMGMPVEDIYSADDDEDEDIPVYDDDDDDDYDSIIGKDDDASDKSEDDEDADENVGEAAEADEENKSEAAETAEDGKVSDAEEKPQNDSEKGE
ncbi:MAG: prolipoprotein diacylglyceryl transferase [Ruminococcus sp.]|nr:prolipoprotein diacylglyceryl transferase [Ruminococcus sp.]